MFLPISIQNVVRLYADHRIKEHTSLLVSDNGLMISIWAFAAVILRWNAYTFIYKLIRIVYGTHNCLPGLLGYLILLATQGFVPQRQFLHRNLPTPLPVLLVSQYFITLPEIRVSSIKL
jgi:hypothetical protein